MPRRKRKNDRFKCELVRIYWDDNHFAGYFIGQIPSANRMTTDLWDLRRRTPTAEVNVFKRSVREYLSPYLFRLPRFRFYELDITVWIPMYFKGGKVITRDVSNFLKISEDSICQALMTDDRLHLDVSIHKRNLTDGSELPHWTFVLTGRKGESHDHEHSHKSIWFKSQVHQEGVGVKPQEIGSRGGKEGEGSSR